MTSPPTNSVIASVAAVLVAGGFAILGAESGRPRLVWIFKPLATVLLLGVVGVPRTGLALWIDAGIALSVVGDLALLGSGNRAFIGGLVAFLLAHLAYLVAFARVAVWSPHVVAVAAAVGLTTTLLLRAIWRGAEGLHGPTVAYGLVISAMVVAASATVGAGFSPGPLAAIGATLFYGSDASLALNRFRRPIPRASVWTMGVYWIGQLGIALAARAG